MRLALIQPDLFWEDKSANLNRLDSFISNITQEVDMIVLPEMFSTGFTMNTALAESMDGEGVLWLQNHSLQKKTLVCGSLMIEDNGNIYNRFLAFHDGVLLHQYDKRHLFRMAGEDEYFDSGNSRASFEYKNWRIRPNVCYDLRFPVWSRNDDEYDIYLNVANWPDRRIHHWKSLLAARAIENQCYAIGVNRVGADGKGIVYSGGTAVFDFNGTPLVWSTEENVVYTTLNKETLQKIREEFPVWKDRDAFRL